jgi:ribose-phosphate pyrophosphokinase
MSSVKLFSGSASDALAKKIAYAYGKPLGELTLQRFSDGEISPHYNESIRGAHVFLIQSTFPPADNIMELLLMIDAARRASAKNVTVVVPYFGYARQDRKDRPRVSIGAKLLANVLSAAGATRIITCDLHAGQIQGFFDIPVDHLYARAVLLPYIKGLELDNLLFASPDVGGVARTRSFASMLQANMVVCDKQRKRANEIASMQIIGDVEGANVILVDDMVDTAGTICNAAKLIREQGALSVRAIATHGVLSGKAHERLNESVLEELIITDTIPLSQPSDKIKVLSVADLFAKTIRKVHDDESISTLFV